MIKVGPRRNVCGRVVREQCKVRIVGTCEVPAWKKAWDPVKGYGVPGERVTRKIMLCVGLVESWDGKRCLLVGPFCATWRFRLL